MLSQIRNKHISTFKSLVLILIFFLVDSCKNEPLGDKEGVTGKRISFHHQVIDSTGVQNPWAKITGDINGDGLPDIIIGAQKGPLVWYRNPDWHRFEIAEGGYDTVDGEAGDIDGDGDLDVVLGGLFWYENPGSLAEQPDRSWSIHQIADHDTHDVELADLNNDGKLDIVTRNQSDFNTLKGNTIHLWINSVGGDWNEQILRCKHGEGLLVTDLDRDEDPDIIGTGFWFENMGDRQWLQREVTDWHDSGNVAVADFNGDGRLDMVLTPSELAGQHYKISWFEQPVNLANDHWIEHPLIDSIECVIHGVAVADFNGDQQVDITYSEMHQGKDPDEVIVLINGNRGSDWSKILLSTTGSHSIQVDDFNGDGRPDIFGANWSGQIQTIEVWIAHME